MLQEDDVVDAVRDWLENDGWTIVSIAHATDRGDDIVARRAGRSLIVEAKGEGSSKQGTSRFGSPFTRNQVGSHVAVAVLRALRVASEGGAIPALAFPGNKHHREAVAKVWPALVKLGVIVFWVGTDNVVEVDGVVAANTSVDQPPSASAQD
jgi:hypothetical protein